MPREKKSKNDKEEGGPLQVPKGTRDIWGDEYFAMHGLLEKASEIALYYGFSPIETPILEYEALFHPAGEYTDMVQKEMYTLRTKGGGKLALRPEVTAPIVRAYIEHGMHALPQPVMLYYGGPVFRHDNPQRGRWREFRQFGLEILGTEKSVADAMIIRIFLTILEEVGLKNISLEINSLGDKDSRGAYKRALGTYFKKYASDLSQNAKMLLVKNPLRLLDSKDAGMADLKKNAPQSIEFLQEPAKSHFKEVLEYLDALGIPYKIENTLVRGLDYYNRTAFEFKETLPEEEGSPDARPLEFGGGGRYDYLGKMLGSKKPLPAVGGAIGVDRILSAVKEKHLAPRILKKPKVFFIQLGFEAKLKSLSVVEILRKARLPVKHSLSKDGLAAQLGLAEKLEIPWVIILGQKEVLEESVIVRNMEDRSQKTVRIDSLADYIKKVIAK